MIPVAVGIPGPAADGFRLKPLLACKRLRTSDAGPSAVDISTRELASVGPEIAHAHAAERAPAEAMRGSWCNPGFDRVVSST